MNDTEPVEIYFPLVWKIARQFPETSIFDLQDYFQIGALALLQALETFDDKRGAKFLTYACIKMRGAIRDELRRVYTYGRGERKFGVKFESIDKLREDSHSDITYIDKNFKKVEWHDTISKLLTTLKGNERLVVLWYYSSDFDLNLKDIGTILHLTESRISQILTKAREKLTKTSRKERL